MDRAKLSVAILAGGDSKRFKSEKALAKIGKKSLLEIMFDIGSALSDNILVVASSYEQSERFSQIDKSATLVVDPDDSPKCSLTGTLTALEYSEREYTLVLPVDAPLTKIPVLRTLVDLTPGHGAVVPIWPNGYIEPLHVVYLTEHAYSCGLKFADCGKRKMSEFLNCLSNVLYISTEVLKHQDPELVTFTNVNTERDLDTLKKKSPKG